MEAARLCLDAGADVNALLPVHKHSTPLHQAAINEDLPMLELLVARGARLDTRDTLWNATPLDWAVHNEQDRRGGLPALAQRSERHAVAGSRDDVGHGGIADRHRFVVVDVLADAQPPGGARA